MAPTKQQLLNRKIKAASSTKSKRIKPHVARYLKKQESQLIETSGKALLLLKGQRCSESLNDVLKDLRALKSPHAKLLSKNNAISPFNDETGVLSLEFLCTKNDCAAFALASHNKKRPNNLILGRTFDRRLLDMVELHVTRYKSLSDYRTAPKKRVGSKPMLLFAGDVWHLDEEYGRLRNLLIDLYRGEPVDKIALSGLDHVLTFTAVDVPEMGDGVGGGVRVYARGYYVKMKKNPAGGSVPVPFLVGCGPDMDFSVRRHQYASKDLWKAAMKQPRAIKPTKTKNQTTNLFGETIGRLHVESQNIDKMGGKKGKALRIAGKIDAEEEGKAIDMELEKEKEDMGKEFEQIYGFQEGGEDR